MRKWLIGISLAIVLLLAGLYGYYKWDNRDLSIEEMKVMQPEYKAKALKLAAEKLPEYAKREGLDPKTFKGPKVKFDGYWERPTYTISYENETHYFVYMQGGARYSILKKTDTEI